MKYFFRLTTAIILMVALMPLMTIVCFIVFIHFREFPFFIQERTGLHQIPFKLIKFKSMSTKMDSYSNLLADNERVTGFGKFLRATSIDELPELINILRGEMAFVGPRPLPTEYLAYYTKSELRRHEVLPGLTGLAQIMGRNQISWRRRLSLDTWYVDHQSICLDFYIIRLTVFKVLFRRGVEVEGGGTMPSLSSQRTKKGSLNEF